MTQYGTNRLQGLDVYGKRAALDNTIVAKADWANITDGNPNGSSSNVNIQAADGQTLYFNTLYFALTDPIEVKQFTIFNYISWGTNLQLCNFDVFMSADLGTLWNNTSRVINYTTDQNNATMSNNIIKFEFSENSRPTAKYIGIRWNDPYNFRESNAGIVLSEICAFGDVVQDEPEPPAAEKTFWDGLKNGLYGADGTQSTELGKMVAAKATGADYSGGINKAAYDKLLEQYPDGNKIYGLTPEITTEKDGYAVAYPDNKPYNRVYDGELTGAATLQLQLVDSTNTPVKIENSPIRMTYDFGASVKPDSIMVAWTSGGSQVMGYEVYLSDIKEDLYQEGNKVASYDATKFEGVNQWKSFIDPVATWIDTSKGQGLLAAVMLPKNASGRYFGIRFTKGVSRNGDASEKILAIGEISVLEAPKEESGEGYQQLLDSLNKGLLSYETGKNDLSYGKMVKDTSGADYVGGMNQTTYDAYREAAGTNLLTALTPEVATAAGNQIVYKDGNYPSRAVDGKIDSSTCFQLSVADSAGKRVYVADSPVTLTYDLGKTAMAESIMIASARGNNQLVQYELYISDRKDTLYSEANKFASYDVSKSVARNRYSDTIENGCANGVADPTVKWFDAPKGPYPYSAQIFIPASAIGRYFGIRVTKTHTEKRISDTMDQIALGELAFFARPYLVYNEVKPAAQAKADYDGENLLKTSKPSVNGLALSADKLIDSDYAAEASAASSEGDKKTISFALDDFYMIEKLVVMSGNGDNRLGGYEVYASLDGDELFDAKNLRASYSAPQGTVLANRAAGGVTVDEYHFNEAFKAKYIGIKVLKANLLTAGDTDKVYLYEIAALGQEMPAYTVDTRVMLKSNAMSYANDTYGVNRLLNGTIEAANVHKSFGYNQAYLFDNDLTEFYIERSGGNPRITFTMRNEILVSNFGIFSAANPYGLGGIRLGEYELYVSENKDDLYSSANLAAHVTPKRHAAMDNATVADFISLKNPKKARYFGIIIKGDNLSDTYVGIRVQEFAVYGSPLSASKDKITALLNSLGTGLLDTKGKNDLNLGKAVATPNDSVAYNGGINQPTYDAINELYYKKNLLSQKEAETAVDDGYTLHSPDGNAARLTDGSIDGSSTWSLQVKKGDQTVPFNESNIRLTYDLGKKSSLELMTVAGSRAANGQQQKYKIYVSAEKDKLYDAENLVTVYDITKNGLANGNPLPPDPYAKGADGVTNKNPHIAQYIDMSGISGRYVGICIAGEKDTVTLGEISVWASKDTYLPQQGTYGLYSEEIFNLIENGDFEAELTAANWGSLTNGLKRENNASDKASHGNYYLVSADSVSQTWKFMVNPETEYTVAFSAKLNGSANTKIAVAYNAEGSEFEDIIPSSISGNVEKGVIALSNTDGKWKRFGYSFYSAEHTEVYITISNTSGQAAMDDFYLFRSDRSYSSDPNDYTAPSTGYVGGVEIVDMETGKTTIEPVSSNTEGDSSGGTSSKGNSLLPITGENAIILVIVFTLFASLTLVSVFVVKKGGKKNEYK